MEMMIPSVWLLGRVHRFLDHLQARRFQTHGLFRRKLGSKPRRREVYTIIHHNAFQRPDLLQDGHSSCTIYNEGGIGGSGAQHEGSSVLQKYDAG